MNEFLRKLIGRVKELWGRWSMLQRLILIGIVVAVLIGIIALFGVSSSPSMVMLYNRPVNDEALLDDIVRRINEEGIEVYVSPTNYIQVADAKTAKRVRMILFAEDLVPKGSNPWSIFDKPDWSKTDFERKVNLQRAQTRLVTDHIKSIDDISDVKVNIVWPEKMLFRSEQKPVSASVIIRPKHGSDIAQNRKKIEGIQKLLKFAIEGLIDENIVITDHTGFVLNDFDNIAEADQQGLIERRAKFILSEEKKYRDLILSSLQHIYTADRVRDLNIKIYMDMSKKVVETEEYFPITIRPRTPGLSYDDSELLKSITRSQSSSETKWEGTGYNPEGPAGVEGQTPPAFRDMNNLYGRMTQETNTQNEEINRRVIQEDRNPQIDRVSISVNIDGTWKMKYDEKGKPIVLADGSLDREYVPLSPEDKRAAELLIRSAIGFSQSRGDTVEVTNMAVDRRKQHGDEDTAYFRKKQVQTTVLVFLSGLTILLVSFILFRMVSREMERRRRIAEDERSRREQAIRESAIAQAEEEGVDVSISVEERTRMELLESVLNMAKEHPEDCAQLIRTWLLEE